MRMFIEITHDIEGDDDIIYVEEFEVDDEETVLEIYRLLSDIQRKQLVAEQHYVCN